MSDTIDPTARSRVRLYKEFGTYDRAEIYSIIDDAPLCHVSVVVKETPYIIPTVHWRIGDKVYIHGAVKNKAIQAIDKGSEACLAFTHFGGYVLTRSAFNHAVVYRSAIAFSKGRFVTDLAEKAKTLEAFVEHIEKGRWAEVRQPTENELKQTGVMEFELNEVSGKVLPTEITPIVFPGGELEVEEDNTVSPWTGILPYRLVKEEPIPSSAIPPLPSEDD
jgi:hypothetical protein